MEEAKNPKPTKPTKKVVITIPGQKSAQDTSNWDDKNFGTPQGRDLIPNMADLSKDPYYIQGKRQPKDHIGPKDSV